MHLELRLWRFTEGVRARIFFSMAVGLLAAALGVARLALLGWLIGRVFAGATAAGLVWPILGIAVVMAARGACEHWRTTVAHRTAALVQKRLRRMLFDRIAALGPSYAGRQRSGALTLSLVDGVEQLETYFGQYLPQLMVSFATPVLIFAFVAFIDLPVAAVLFAFALAALFLPAAWHSRDVKSSRSRQSAYAAFGAEFLDSIQGLGTLKAFGQSAARAEHAGGQGARAFPAHHVGARHECALARHHRLHDRHRRGGGAGARRLARQSAGETGTRGPARDPDDGRRDLPPDAGPPRRAPPGHGRPVGGPGHLRHSGRRAGSGGRPGNAEADGLEPAIAFENVTFRYPGARGPAHRGLSFSVAPGERIGVVGQSGCGKTSIVRLLLRFFDPDSGRVTLGGIDLREMSFAQIRRNISVVNQDTFLFHGTIGENILMGRPDASAEEVEEAARIANIRGFIDTLPDGYDTDHRREGHQAFGRAAPAGRDCPRGAARHADPGAGRGPFRRGRRE